MASARALFSILVPDGVQGVPAVPAVKVQVPETSGCRHCTEVSSAKHQVSSLLSKNPFYVLSVPVPQRAPKSILKRDVFDAKNLGAWADLEDDQRIARISGFKSTKCSQFLSSNVRPKVCLDCTARGHETAPRPMLVSTAESHAGLLFKVCYFADEAWSDADVDAEIHRVSRGKLHLHDLSGDKYQSPDEAPVCAPRKPAPAIKKSSRSGKRHAAFEKSFPAHCAGFEALTLPWVILRPGNRTTKSRRRGTRSAPRASCQRSQHHSVPAQETCDTTTAYTPFSLRVRRRDKQALRSTSVCFRAKPMTPEEQQWCVDVSQCRADRVRDCLLYTSPSPRDRQKSRMPSCA